MTVSYTEGDQVAVVVTFTNTDGTAETPTLFDAWYRPPGGTNVDMSASLTTEATGVVSMPIPPFDTAGLWTWGVAGTGGVVANVEGVIQVRATRKDG